MKHCSSSQRLFCSYATVPSVILRIWAAYSYWVCFPQCCSHTSWWRRVDSSTPGIQLAGRSGLRGGNKTWFHSAESERESRWLVGGLALEGRKVAGWTLRTVRDERHLFFLTNHQMLLVKVSRGDLMRFVSKGKLLRHPQSLFLHSMICCYEGAQCYC